MLAEMSHHQPVQKPKWKWDVDDHRDAFRATLGEWFERDGCDYPWRQTQDPYAILVSEIMLQQTQIATVLNRGFYTRFMQAFPDIPSLAAADDDRLLKIWEGLGYYRRARLLRDAARAIIRDHAGVFPQDFEAILALPGVGRYTAGAVASFAFGHAAPVVDGNVARVISRLMDAHAPIDQRDMQKQLWAWAEAWLDPAAPGRHNSAMMELGQTHCRKSAPSCHACPVAGFCRTREPASLPQKTPRPATIKTTEQVVFARRGDQVLLRQLGAGRRQGMWRLPEREPSESRPIIAEHTYGITKYRVTMRVHSPPPRLRARRGEHWQPIETMDHLAIPPADRAVIEKLLRSDEEFA